MSSVPVEPLGTSPRGTISLPAELERRLYDFRSLVWRIKLAEAVCGAVCGVVVGYLLLFVLDRLTETPGWFRWLCFAAAVGGCTLIPWTLHRWVWSHRGLDQLARLIARRFPAIGDQLLGIIEIVRSESDLAAGGRQQWSRRLCEAAIAQVAGQSARYDFEAAVPRPRHRLWAVLAAVPVVAALVAAATMPAAAVNAWARFLMPWRTIERYAFTRVDRLPARIVVPRGEPAALAVGLAADTRQRPAEATVRIGTQKPLTAALAEQTYAFTLPPQLEDTEIRLAVGDARERARLVPLPRPGIVSVTARVTLPDYLGRPEPVSQDVRGGTVTPVLGSAVEFDVTADRDLARATVDGAVVSTAGSSIRTPVRTFSEETRVAIGWRDHDGLDQATPLTIVVAPRPDEPPAVSLQDPPGSREMLLVSDTLRFAIAVRDDFGIKEVGLEWQGDGENPAGNQTKGDRLLTAGGPREMSLDVAATFCPETLGIRPQPIVLRAFAEDYLPGRGRVYGPPIVLYIVDAAEHGLVVNERLGRWRQQAGEVRDREMSLLAANKELRRLPAEKLGDAATRAKLEQQAAAEETQARRMDKLVAEGGKLVREALKNPEFEADVLEDLAEDIQTLAEIADTRMPSVAELLKAAARARAATAAELAQQLADAGKPGQPGSGKPGEAAPGEGKPGAGKPGASGKPADQKLTQSGKPNQSGQPQDGKPSQPSDTATAQDEPPKVGADRNPQSGKPGGGEPSKPKPPVPQVVDRESSQQPAAEAASQDGGKKPGGGQGRLGLPTTVAGVAPPKKPGEQQPAADQPADEAVDAAIKAQEALLEQFAKVADELAAVMARLEGTTFVKRLKLASREQGTIGNQLAGLAVEAFGKADRRTPAVERSLKSVGEFNAKEADKVSNLMDDLQAYFDRRQLPAFRTVLEEMKELDTLGSLRQLTTDIEKEAGMSIAQAEFWSDTFDRLADELVTPPKGGSGGGGGSGKSRPSLPPEVVLEAMRILEAEMILREETRVVEQSRKVITPEKFAEQAAMLAKSQDLLAGRVGKLATTLADAVIGDLPFGQELPLFGPLPIPDGSREFAPEIELFRIVEQVMQEGTGILRSPHTGPKAIAAETEAIELLLSSQSPCGCNGGGGGGGGGASPGGGSTGSTRNSALALVGRGAKDKGAGEDVEKQQATGVSGRVLPDEFRAGLDAYFNRFEQERR